MLFRHVSYWYGFGHFDRLTCNCVKSESFIIYDLLHCRRVLNIDALCGF